MNLAALIRRVRIAADDIKAPYLWRTEDIIDWLNDGQTEAAIRGRLLRATPQTHSDMCEVQFGVGVSDAELDQSLVEISHQYWKPSGEGIASPLLLVSREWLDGKCQDWRTLAQEDRPTYLVRDANLLRLVPAPSIAGSVMLEGYRVPIAEMENDEDEPEIAAAHHIHLVNWALHKGYSIPDADTFDPGRADRVEAEFTRYFGARPDSDLRNDTRLDEPQHVVAYWP